MRRFRSGDPCIEVSSEDLQRMTAEELEDLGASVGLDLSGTKTRGGLINKIIAASREVANF